MLGPVYMFVRAFKGSTSAVAEVLYQPRSQIQEN